MQLGKLLWGANIYADGPDPSYQLYAIILYEQPNGSTDEMVNKLGGGPEVDYHTQELEDMRDLKRQVVLISTSEVHPGPLREREHPPPPPPRLCSPRPALGSGGRPRAAGQLSGRAVGRAPPAGLGPRAPGVLQTD